MILHYARDNFRDWNDGMRGAAKYYLAAIVFRIKR